MFERNVDYILWSQQVNNYEDLKLSDYKYSYFLLKPNSAIHFATIMKELERQKFDIFNCYAIYDYESTNMSLHANNNVSKYLIPISQMYHDFYGNFAVLVVVRKNNIAYEDFVLQVYRLKMELRDKFSVDYVAFAFDISKIGKNNEEQLLQIIGKDGTEVKKDSMNKPGTFMVFLTNEIHSPDANVKNTIDEINLLRDIGVICAENVIPKNLVEAMMKYETYNFLLDM